MNTFFIRHAKKSVKVHRVFKHWYKLVELLGCGKGLSHIIIAGCDKNKGKYKIWAIVHV